MSCGSIECLADFSSVRANPKIDELDNICPELEEAPAPLLAKTN